jgi:N-acetylglucosaminyldiphosphoundecaprenol N-acetyl-beta-D-mannosaminyltransferase
MPELRLNLMAMTQRVGVMQKCYDGSQIFVQEFCLRMQTNSSMDAETKPVQVINVLGVNFQKLDYVTALALFQHWIDSKIAHQVCIANVHTLVSCQSDQQLRDINNRSLVTLDGLPLVWYANLVLRANVGRVCGPDLMLNCLDHGRGKGWKHFFLGGKPEVLQDLQQKMLERFPGVAIVGLHSPPFRELSVEEDQQLVDMINASEADFLWVGLGAPKQEKWIAAHLDRIGVPVQLGVGAAFDFHSGHLQRAPLWMQKNGLEWLYRMAMDKRLVKRYLSTNPKFLMLFLRDWLLVRLLRRRPG